jgi:HEAT repeat protein
VRNTAFESLLELTKDEGLVKRAWGMKTYNDRYRTRALQWYQASKPDQAREMALGVLAEPDSETLRVAAIRALGALKDKPGERRVLNALSRLMRERSFEARSAAVSALSSYGDPAAIDAIEPLTKHSLHYMRNTAKDAVASLKAKQG